MQAEVSHISRAYWFISFFLINEHIAYFGSKTGENASAFIQMGKMPMCFSTAVHLRMSVIKFDRFFSFSHHISWIA